MLPNQTLEVLRFLALPQAEKLRYLPSVADGSRYITPDGEAEIEFAAEAAARVAFRAVDLASVDAPEAIRPLLLEIRCVIEMMVDLAEQVDYMWFLDKRTYLVSGPYDDAWLVLQRLAGLALQKDGQTIQPPTTAFIDLLRATGFQTTTRRASSSE